MEDSIWAKGAVNPHASQGVIQLRDRDFSLVTIVHMQGPGGHTAEAAIRFCSAARLDETVNLVVAVPFVVAHTSHSDEVTIALSEVANMSPGRRS